MKINGITPNLINTYYGNSSPLVSNTLSNENNIQTSIYNQKGVTLPFCARFKPLNACEVNCILMLKGVKDGTRQRFRYLDIKGIFTYLRQEKEPQKMEKFLGDLLDALNDTEYDKNSFKRIVQLTAGKSEDEQFVILGFVDHELNNAVEPLKAFCELPAEKRQKLMPFLERISYSNASEDTTEALYDTFRVLVYADEDMAKLKGQALNKYKVDTCQILRDNIEYFENKGDKGTVSIAKDIYRYFTDNMI